jgi:hypothetical protein
VKSLRHALVLLVIAVPALLAQDRPVIVGAGLSYTLPVGSLADRFNGSLGWMAYAGTQVSQRWTWTGKFEYFELSDLNEDELTKSVTVDVGGAPQKFEVPLTKLAMSLKAAGVTAEAALNLTRSSWLESNVRVGFGFYYWDYERSAYYDSLFVQVPGAPAPVKVAELAVPAGEQYDWSGSVNLGLDVGVHAVGPVWLTVGADYRLIIGELWQVLDLDMESVSGIQSLCFRGTVNVRF